ncbi:unnamed protein product, partial [Amoebophrya sp. A120]
GDASKKGWGVTASSDTRRWKDGFRSIDGAASSSNKRELAMWSEAFELAAPELAGSLLLVRTDNKCARHYLSFYVGNVKTLSTFGKLQN